MRTPGKLTFFCGKMGAGKSTLSKKIARDTGAIRLSEDEWLSEIYPNMIQSPKDYHKYSSNLKKVLKDPIREMLLQGISVVLDFPANTHDQRAWFKEILGKQSISHELIFLDISDSVCLKNLKKRNKAEPDRSNFDTVEVFEEMSKYFSPPNANEGFSVTIYND